MNTNMLHHRVAIGLSALTLLGTCALVFLAFFDDVDPIESHRLIAAEGIGIGSTSQLIITREFCFKRASEAEALRVFRSDTEEDDQEVEYQQPPILVHLDAGCGIRSRRTPLPDDIRPGRYRYKAALKWCNGIGRCQTTWLPDIGVTIIGENDRRIIRARPLEPVTPPPRSN